MQGITLDEVKTFVPTMLGSLRLDALYHGNALESDARDMLALVTRYLQASAKAPVSGFGTVLKLPLHSRIVQEMAIAHDDSGIVVYLQAPDDSLHTRALVNLLATMMGSPFFDALRTQQQLGYVVNAGTMSVLKVNALALTIESPVADPLELEARINAFLGSYAQMLAAMPPEQFAAIKSGFLNDLRQVPDQLDALSSRYWDDILLEEFNADSGLKMADAVAGVTQQEVLDYYRAHVADLGATRVVARSAGRPHMAGFVARRKEPLGTVVIQAGHTSYADYKAGKQLYTYP